MKTICLTCHDPERDGHAWTECTNPCFTCGKEHFRQACIEVPELYGHKVDWKLRDRATERLHQKERDAKVRYDKAALEAQAIDRIYNLVKSGQMAIPPRIEEDEDASVVPAPAPAPAPASGSKPSAKGKGRESGLNAVFTLFGVAAWVDLWPDWHTPDAMFTSTNARARTRKRLNEEVTGIRPLAADSFLVPVLKAKGKWPPPPPMILAAEEDKMVE
ncbi:uncharacterized protein RCC_04349 [Ramularia collo-cygni]|uniref:Uncharacterized protein n=1 Tax=Ramularia collo-cygni TaxID=112498 RepID=A0A2D3V7H3_9PEZI|nr:uncharacterized protein RCC_04349 [Ramularia collo-cygni]CZT18504.1 uncharacterized protein RCC_04349 [Ramularia collo-cygni]